MYYSKEALGKKCRLGGGGGGRLPKKEAAPMRAYT